MRLDQFLVLKNLVRSRSQAKELVEKGLVLICGQVAKKASLDVDENLDLENIVIKEDKILKYVSRAGVKLENALNHLGLIPTGFRVLDVGLSTGGFSDCLLQLSAKHIIGIDVGSNQLADRLKANRNLISYDNINAKKLSDYTELADKLSDLDLIVMDVSFISIKLILPELVKFMSKDTLLLSLVKPQFELDKKKLNKQGIVKDESSYETVEQEIKDSCASNNLEVMDYFSSGMEGRDGNKEYFVYAKKNIV